MLRETPNMPMIVPSLSHKGILVVDSQLTQPSIWTACSSLPISGWPVRMISCSFS
jgi:hypothetical protein